MSLGFDAGGEFVAEAEVRRAQDLGELGSHVWMGECTLLGFPVLAGVFAGGDDGSSFRVLVEGVHSGFDSVETVGVIAVCPDSHTTLVHTRSDNRMTALTEEG